MTKEATAICTDCAKCMRHKEWGYSAEYICQEESFQKRDPIFTSGTVRVVRPYCKDQNVDGKCPMFEKKTTKKVPRMTGAIITIEPMEGRRMI